MQKTLSYRIPKIILLVVFSALVFWWAVLFFIHASDLNHENLVWGATYQVVAFIGAACGLFVSKSWGGYKSLVGRAILMFSIGLLLQNFGQTVFSIYNVALEIDVPYPSLADFGFFLSIPFYVYGAYLVGSISGSKISLQSYHNKAFAVIVPALLLGGTYYLFLRGYFFDSTDYLRTFLDFAYPLGQAIYISLAILALIFSKNYLGGAIRSAMMFVLSALVMQYVADFNFLYEALNGTWVNGGYGDFLYLLSYGMMALALIKFGETFSRIRNAQ